MKRLIFFTFLFFSSKNFAQQSADAILGKWYNEEKTARFEIYKTGATYNSKIIALTKPKDDNGNPILDAKNPDKSLRNRTVLGITIFKDLVYDKDKNRWDSGRVYNPEMGVNSDCKIKLISKNELIITGTKMLISIDKKWLRYE